MKGVCHEDKVNRLCCEICQIVSVTRYEIAISHAALFEAVTRHLQQIAVNVDCEDVMCDFGNLQGKPASPEHRSITSMPDRRPTAASTPAGLGQSASHHPAVGISVP